MTGLPNVQQLASIHEPANFQELVAQAMDQRKSVQLRNTEARDRIMVALQAAHAENAPWKTMLSPTEVADNVTKRLNVSCSDAFRMNLMIHDGGRVTFPKQEGSEPHCASDSTAALIEIAQRYAVHRLPYETITAKTTLTIR